MRGGKTHESKENIGITHNVVTKRRNGKQRDGINIIVWYA
jgi:hypothetical protein